MKDHGLLISKASDYFIEFVKYDIMLDGITPRTIKDFDIYLKNVRRLAPVTCGMHMGTFEGNNQSSNKG